MQQRRQIHFLVERVSVHDSTVSCTNNVAVLEDRELRLKAAHDMHRVLRVRQHKASLHLVELDTLELHTHIVSRHSCWHLLVYFVKDSQHLDRRLVGHEHQRIALLHLATLQLADNVRTHIRILFAHRHLERRTHLAVAELQVVEVRQQRWTFVPRAITRLLFQIGARERRHGNENDICLGVEATCTQERRQFRYNLVKALLVPAHRRVVHLVHHHNQALHTGRLDQHSMLTRLATTLKACLKLTTTRRNDQNRHIGLGRTTNHIRHVRLVARRV